MWQIRCQAKDISIDIQDHEAFDPQIHVCKTVRKTRTTELMDREEGSTGATNLDYTLAPDDDGTIAKEVTQEAREAMKNLAQEVSNTSLTSMIVTL